MALTFDTRPAPQLPNDHRTAPQAALDTAPSPALTRRREAQALVQQAEALTNEAWEKYVEAKADARELLMRALSIDITLEDAWKQGDKLWPFRGEAPPEYARRGREVDAALRAAAARKKQAEEWEKDKYLAMSVFIGVPVLCIAIGLALGAWLF